MKEEMIKDAARFVLGAGLIFAGISHLTFSREDFQVYTAGLCFQNTRTSFTLVFFRAWARS
jgi:hypothetical protein